MPFSVRYLPKMNVFQYKLVSIPSECQTDWIQIRTNILLGLVSVQTSCKGYQQAAAQHATTLRTINFYGNEITILTETRLGN